MKRSRRAKRRVFAFLMVFAAAFPGGLAPSVSRVPEARLLQAEPELLAKARAYCRRLQTASLDFVCREEITETVAGPTRRFESLDSFNSPPAWIKARAHRHRLVYDYQFVRGGAVAKEVRTLVEEDGVRKKIPDADLMTRLFRYENVLFGPATFLDDRNFKRYIFAAEAEEKAGGLPAAVFHVRPRTEEGIKSPPFGRMWVSTANGAVWKIEWDERTLGGYSAIEERAKELKAEPRLTMTSEFGFEKNGIRFPSRHAIVEAYRREKEGLWVRSTTEVAYVGYRFFTVETAVDIK